MNRSVQYLTIALSILLSCLFGIITVFTTNDNYFSTMNSYANSGKVIHLNRVPEDKASQVSTLIMNTANEHHCLIIRGDPILKQDGSTGGYKFGFYGDAHKHGSDSNMYFLGSEVFNETNISKLLKSPQGATLGLDSVSADQISTLPSIWAGNKIVGVKLTDLIQKSGTINGNYRFIGLPSNDYKTLITGLSKTLQVPTEKISSTNSGFYAYDNLMKYIVYAAIVATWLTLLFLAVVGAYQSMGVMGTHLLLGWSRSSYAIKVFSKLAFSSLLSSILSCIIFISALQGFSYTFPLIIRGILSGTPAISLTLIAILLASISLLKINPVAAIRQRISVKLLSCILIIFYLLANISVVTGMYAIDGPIQQVAQMKQIQQRWEAYSDLQVLYKEKVGKNASSMTGQSTDHAKEYYDWYRSIQKKDGVYLVNTVYFSDHILNVWRNNNIYGHIPDTAFWQITASPNYLTKYGMNIDKEIIDQAYAGVRVFLIPSTLNSKSRKLLEGYLTDDSLKKRESSIATVFNKKQKILFVTYKPERDIFLWNDKIALPNVSKDPIVLVSTAENMIPTESESLWAAGLTNSYIKLDKSAANKYLTPRYLSTYHLDDNTPEFLPVHDFIAGLTKTLTETIQLFGVAIMILLGLTMIIIVGLVKIYSTMRHEEIAVKRLLGHPIYSLFMYPLLLVAITSTICIIIALVLRTFSGVIVMSFFLLIQLSLLFYQARKTSSLSVATMINTA